MDSGLSFGDVVRNSVAVIADQFMGNKVSLPFKEYAETKLLKKKALVTVESRCQMVAVDEAELHQTSLSIFKPLIFRGAAKAWPCMRELSLESLKSNRFDLDIFNVKTLAKEPLGKIIETIQGGGLAAVKFDPLLSHGDVENLFDMEWLNKRKPRFSYSSGFQSFLGADGDFTPLHSGSVGNLFTQIEGRKRWWIFPYWNNAFMRTYGQRGQFRRCDANPKKLEDKNFPLLKYSKFYYTELEPGDVLWNPPFAMHSVENEGASVALAYKWISDFENMKLAPLLTVVDMLERGRAKLFRSETPDTTYRQVRYLHRKEKASSRLES